MMTSYDYIEQYGPIESWAEIVADSILATYPEPKDLHDHHPGEWVYQNGLFINALFALWQKTGRREYFQYVVDWVNVFIDEAGNFRPGKYHPEEFRLDDILPGRVLIALYAQTKLDKYKRAALTLLRQLQQQPRTTEGGYWHKQIYPNQMWLDGIYMADLFSMEIARDFDKPEFFNEAVHQIMLMHRHAHDPQTGLLYHGWDENKTQVWAHLERGTSPEFWGRAIGWYMMALVDGLDILPPQHQGRDELVDILHSLADSVAGYQDSESALWYQVVNRGDREDNWIETSCSAMFAYAFAKGARLGYLGSNYRERAETAYRNLIERYVRFDKEKRWYLTEIVCVGSLRSQADYEYYVTTARRDNDFKGVGAFLYLCIEMEH